MNKQRAEGWREACEKREGKPQINLNTKNTNEILIHNTIRVGDNKGMKKNIKTPKNMKKP